MALILDHIFILTDPGASGAQSLVDIGLVEGSGNVHAGQGSANRRFFLPGFTIELLFINDSAEAQNGAGRKLGLLQRYTRKSASPFGLVVRTSATDALPDFPNWSYYPDYFGADLCFYVADNSANLNEPLCICMPPALAQRPLAARDNANPDWQLSSALLQVPGATASAAFEHFVALDKLRVEFARAHHLTLCFNQGTAGQSINLAPQLPLTMQW